MRSHSPLYNTTGFIRFLQTPETTIISGVLSGLTPNQQHAFHIHELGDLSDPVNGCLSLSSHFNPYGETHGGPHSCHRHVGDLGNLKADGEGVAKFEFQDGKIHLVGPHSIIGRSCVVHLYEDDMGEGGTEES